MSITIKKASELTGFSEHTLKYYEKIGLKKDVKRNTGKGREYTEGNINWLLFLKKLKTTGMPIESMKHYAGMKYQGEVTSSARKVLLFNHRKQIVQQINTLQENLKAIDKKIEFYINKEKNNGS